MLLFLTVAPRCGNVAWSWENRGETPEAHQSRVGSKSSSFIMFFSKYTNAKEVLAAVFILLGQDVPGCAILVFLGNPPKNYPKLVFLIVSEWFLQKCGQKRSEKSGCSKSAQSLIVSFVKNVVLRRYASNRCAWMCHLSVLWQPATSGVEKKHLATQKMFHIFFALNV